MKLTTERSSGTRTQLWSEKVNNRIFSCGWNYKETGETFFQQVTVSQTQISFFMKKKWKQLHYLYQWFPTGVPRHTRVPQRGVRKCRQILNYCLFMDVLKNRLPKIFIFDQEAVPQNFFMTCRKKVAKHWFIPKVFFTMLAMTWEKFHSQMGLARILI